jgi:predicted Na+-dependent transporter
MAKLLVPLTLFAIMFALGVGIHGDAGDMLRRRRWLLLRLLFGTCVLVPLVALLLLKLPAAQVLSPTARFGIALMALCPSAPLALRKAGKKGGDRDLAALLQVGAAVVAIVSIPLMADLFRAAFAIQGWNIEAAHVARQVGISQVLPLGLGLALRRWQPALADRIEDPLNRIADLLLLVLVVVVLALTGHLLIPFMAANALALAFMALMVVAALAIGVFLSGADRQERTTVALVTSMRNPGLALLFAGLYAPKDGGLKLAIVAYLLMTVLVSVPFLRWQQRPA